MMMMRRMLLMMPMINMDCVFDGDMPRCHDDTVVETLRVMSTLPN